MRNYRQRGHVLPWVNGNGSEITSGEVVIVGDKIGVAVADIGKNEPGELAIRGVFELPADGSLSQGATLYWDHSGKKLKSGDGASKDDIANAAFVWAANESESDTVLACLTPDAAAEISEGG